MLYPVFEYSGARTPMIEIIPAVLPKTFAELEDGLATLAGVSREVQIDLVGRNVLAEHDQLAHGQDFDFEIDIMLPMPHHELDAILAYGPSRIIIHAQNEHAHEALEQLQSLRDGNYPVLTGVALMPTVSPEVLEEFTGLYDFVQVMGIDRVGAQGQPFNPAAVELVRRLRAIHPTLPLQVDGHAAGHEQELVAAGVDRLVVGAAIIAAADPKAAFKEIYNKANGSER